MRRKRIVNNLDKDKYHSQCNQDVFLESKIFKSYKDGFFC